MFCTFYGFRGGSGQTTTLAMVARALALSGAQVTVMDLAPHPSNLGQLLGLGATPVRGLLDRVHTHLEGNKTLPSVVDLLQDVPLPRKSQGRLRFLGYGGQPGGLHRQEIPWASLYDQFDGYLFLEDLLAEIRATVEPDLVLVDAGAGLGDGAAVAVRQIADVLVLFCRPGAFDLELLEQGCTALARGRAPEERLLVWGPAPHQANEANATRVEAALRGSGASKAVVVPWSPTLALTGVSEGYDEGPVPVYQNIATWIDGSTLSPTELKARIGTLARRPFCLEKLLARIKVPSSAVVATFRTTLSRQSEPWALAMARQLAISNSPFVWRAAAAAALTRSPQPFSIVTTPMNPAPPSLHLQFAGGGRHPHPEQPSHLTPAPGCSCQEVGGMPAGGGRGKSGPVGPGSGGGPGTFE